MNTSQRRDDASSSTISTEQSNPRIFHIHVDSQYISQEFLNAALGLGFKLDNFGAHPEFVPYFGPSFMLSFKTPNSSTFKQTWDRLVSAMDAHDFRGYAEGEYIPTDHIFENKPFNGEKPPFRISRRKLRGGAEEPFRETEIHLSMDARHSDPQLIMSLIEAGLYAAFYKKPQGDYIILTMQGSKSAIRKIKDLVRDYVERAGGAFNASLKEEIAIKHHLRGVGPESLPEVAQDIFLAVG